MTTIDLNKLSNKDLSKLHGRYPYYIICSLGDLELSPNQDSYIHAPSYTDDPDEDDEYDNEGYIIHNREQLYDFIRDLTGKIHEALESRSPKNLGAPLDDETNDIYNAIDVLKALTELDFQ